MPFWYSDCQSKQTKWTSNMIYTLVFDQSIQFAAGSQFFEATPRSVRGLQQLPCSAARPLRSAQETPGRPTAWWRSVETRGTSAARLRGADIKKKTPGICSVVQKHLCKYIYIVCKQTLFQFICCSRFLVVSFIEFVTKKRHRDSSRPTVFPSHLSGGRAGNTKAALLNKKCVVFDDF